MTQPFKNSKTKAPVSNKKLPAIAHLKYAQLLSVFGSSSVKDEAKVKKL